MLSDQFKSNLNEFNNDLEWKRQKNVSFSSASSSSQTDSNEEISKQDRKASLQEVIERTEDMRLVSYCILSFCLEMYRFCFLLCEIFRNENLTSVNSD